MLIIIRKKLVIVGLLFLSFISALFFILQDSHAVFGDTIIDTIIIDPGHGGNDPGAIGVSKTKEKDINLQVSLALKSKAEALGFNIVMTRETDVALYNDGSKNKKRSDLSNRKNSTENVENAVFISIHMNKFEQESVKGAQTFYSDREDSRILAEYIQEEFRKTLDDNNRVAMQIPKSVYLLQNVHRPTVLVECGFLSNRGEEQLLSTDAYRNQIADCILNGVISFINKPESLK